VSIITGEFLLLSVVYRALFTLNDLAMVMATDSTNRQARSQDFTLGATEAARVHFFPQKS